LFDPFHPNLIMFQSHSKERNEKWNDPIKAVLCFNDPTYWGRELQILTDVARSNGVPGTTSTEQVVNLYFSGPDFEYAANFPLPRFGSGAFVFCLEKLFHKLCDRHLTSTVYGKPETSSYRYIEEVLSSKYGQIHAQDRKSERQLHRVYAIGDNPLTDIKGANGAGGKWRSMLVRTGVWQGDLGQLDAYQPHFICDDVWEALRQIVHHENETI
jgi:HAD superfamily hydrolase (TIGR01456 family)